MMHRKATTVLLSASIGILLGLFCRKGADECLLSLQREALDVCVEHAYIHGAVHGLMQCAERDWSKCEPAKIEADSEITNLKERYRSIVFPQ